MKNITIGSAESEAAEASAMAGAEISPRRYTMSLVKPMILFAMSGRNTLR